jgi:hypothetical protein
MCPRFESLVRRYNAGRVSEEEAHQVEAHLEICFDCKRAAARPMSRRELDHSPILKKSRPVAAWLTLAIAAGVCLALLSGKLSIDRSGIPYWPASGQVQTSR